MQRLLKRIANRPRILNFEREEIREAWICQRESLQSVLNAIDDLIDELGPNYLLKCSRQYRFKFARTKYSIIRPVDRNFDESILYVAEGLVKGYYPTKNGEIADIENILPLALNLLAHFLELAIFLEGSTCDDSFEIEAAAKLEKFDQSYVVFEQELIYTLSASFAVCLMSDNVFEGRQMFGIFLEEGFEFALKKNLLSMEEVANCDPNMFFTVPRISVLVGCYLGWFKSVGCAEEINDSNPNLISFYHNPYFLQAYDDLNRIQNQVEELNMGERALLEQRLINSKEPSDPSSIVEKLFIAISELAHLFQSGKYSNAYREMFSMILKSKN